MSNKSHIFGIHPVLEALKSDTNIDKIFLLKEIKPTLRSEIMGLAKAKQVPVQFVPVEKLKRLVNGNHQGIVATITPIPFHDIEHLVPWWFENSINPLVLVLDEITDVRNFGAIARTAECAGVHAIIIPVKNAAQINAQAVKASAGALYNIPICRSNNLTQTLIYLKQSGLTVFACTEKAEKNYTNCQYTQPLAIVFGSEEYGISSSALLKADELIKIPMFGSISSLNVSVSTGIVLFEAIKQRTKSFLDIE